MLDINKTALVVVDVQGKLAEAMAEKEALYANLRRLILGGRALGLPAVWTEQIPEKLGPTVAELRDLLAGQTPLPKTAFSCWGDEAFRSQIRSLGRSQILLAGIETHVCVYQTAADLKAEGLEPYVVADAVSSRTLANKRIGLERIQAAGGQVTSVETALFELMRTSTHPAFRDILKIVK